MNPNAVQEERGPRKKVRCKDTEKNKDQEVLKKSKTCAKPSKLEEGKIPKIDKKKVGNIFFKSSNFANHWSPSTLRQHDETMLPSGFELSQQIR